MEIVRSEQYNNPEALQKVLEKYQAKLIVKNSTKGYLVYQSLNTGYIIKVSKFGYLYKVNYYKPCDVCDK